MLLLCRLSGGGSNSPRLPEQHAADVEQPGLVLVVCSSTRDMRLVALISSSSNAAQSQAQPC